jgi:hypothetical protein
MNDIALKVVVQNRILSGTDNDRLWQRVATVYVQSGPLGGEYRIYAPPRATGDALEWVEHFTVRQSHDPDSESEVSGSQRTNLANAVKEELENLKRDATYGGMNPDGIYYDAQICEKGHVQTSTGFPFTKGEYCPRCGAPCITDCRQCNAPIRGQTVGNRVSYYKPPSFCHKCGRPYPWMKERLDTARALVYHDDKLTIYDRNGLWDLLQYVISDPRSDLVPAKRKLIEINLEKAARVTREFVLDLLAKVVVEAQKP